MDYNQSYSKVVNNITEVNPYNVEFEENINYSMYSTIIGQIELDKDKDVLTEGDSKYSRVIQNPYKLIEKARKTFRHLLRNVPIQPVFPESAVLFPVWTVWKM